MNRWIRIGKPWMAPLTVLWLACVPVIGEVVPAASSAPSPASVDSSFPARLNRVVELIEESNAPHLIGHQRWDNLLARHRPAIERALSHTAFADMVNALLAAGGVSHFHYYSNEEWTYWFLRSTFERGNLDAHTAHIGIFPERFGARWFVRGILEGSPAANTEIGVGDELIAVDGRLFEPVSSFRGKAGQEVRLLLRRGPGVVYDVYVTPVRESLYEAVQQAVGESVRITETAEFNYAYLHGWTLLGDGEEYWKLLDIQDDVDGLILDYRDGFGGIVGRGNGFLFGPLGKHRHWTKPTVILIADGTRSAKELLVAEAQRRNRAPLVGTPTPGHVTSVGGLRRVGSDGLLLLPQWCHQQEGNSTHPDYLVEREIRFCAGKDVQLERAEDILRDLIQDAGTTWMTP